MSVEKILNELAAVEHVFGVLLLDAQGKVLHASTADNAHVAKVDWSVLPTLLTSSGEADVVYRDARLYLRGTAVGLLVLFLDADAPMAMIRIQCDLAQPKFKARPETLQSAGVVLGKLFKKT